MSIYCFYRERVDIFEASKIGRAEYARRPSLGTVDSHAIVTVVMGGVFASSPGIRKQVIWIGTGFSEIYRV